MAPWSTDIKSFESVDINSERSEQRPLKLARIDGLLCRGKLWLEERTPEQLKG